MGGLENQLGEPRFSDLVFKLFGQPKLFQPVGDGDFQDMGLLLHFRRGKVEGELPPHVGGLEVVGAEEQLAGVKGAVRRVANLPVGLDNRLSSGEVALHVVVDVGKDLGEEGLTRLVKGQGVPVAIKTVDEVLGQVGTAHHAQLAKEGQSTIVQPTDYTGPHLGGGPSGSVGLGGLLLQQSGFLQDLLLPLHGQVLEDGHMLDQPVVRGVE